MRTLITGVTGQDGSYLSELLLEQGHEVFGMTRQVAAEHESHRFWRMQHLLPHPRFKLVHGSVEEFASVWPVVWDIKPDAVFHLAAQSFVHYSFADEFSTMTTNVTGTHNMLAATRAIVPNARFYFAASSEMFGEVEETPQRETTRFHPRSVYGVSKVAGFELTRHYRERGMFACSGILFNHTSPRRSVQFVTRKISLHVAAIYLALEEGKPPPTLKLGNLAAKRDWLDARDCVRGMVAILNHHLPGDWVLASGTTWSIEQVLQYAFCEAGLLWPAYVEIDPRFTRPTEVNLLLGDAQRAQTILNWKPERAFPDTIREMVRSDIKLLRENDALRQSITPA